MTDSEDRSDDSAVGLDPNSPSPGVGPLDVAAAIPPANVDPLALDKAQPPPTAVPAPKSARTAQGRLPAGMVLDGQLVRDVVYRPSDGQLRIKLAALANDPAKLLDAYLEACIVSIGGQKPNEHLIRCLTVGDRDYSALKIYSVTYGGPNKAKPQTTYRCGCGAPCTAQVNVEEFEVFELDDELLDTAEAGSGKQRRTCRAFTVVLPEHGLRLAYRHADGYDQKAVSELGYGNLVQATYAMMTRTCIFWEKDGKQESPPFPLALLAYQEDNVLADIEQAYVDASSGLGTSHEVKCWKCGRYQEVTFTVADFIGRVTERKKKSTRKFS